jgi:hypothetical protein
LSWEQPFPVPGSSGAGIGLAFGGEREQQRAERGGDGDVVPTELEVTSSSSPWLVICLVVSAAMRLAGWP